MMFLFIIVYGILLVWEYLFDFIILIRFMEFFNFNYLLLKRFLFEVLGIYYYSLIVGNLVEIVCEVVGGNYFFVCIGVYYYDIGKLKRFFYFKENQIIEEDFYNRIIFIFLVFIIILYIKDGVEIGKEYRLLRQVFDIIKQYYGIIKVVFFYGKVLS